MTKLQAQDSPMLAQAIDFEKIETKCNGYVMEPKLDGVRCIAVKTFNETVHLFTRSGRQTLEEKVPHIASRLKEMFPRKTVILDGELGFWKPGEFGTAMDFNRTMRVIGSLPFEAQNKQAAYDDPLCYCVFDILEFEGLDFRPSRQTFRRQSLVDIFNAHRYYSFEDVPVLGFVSQQPKWDFNFYTSIVEAGGEGVILKNPNATYRPGKRLANTWYKVKKYDTMDVIIDGFEPGQGKYSGQIGALWFGLKDTNGDVVRFGKCSGMDDATRTHMTDHFFTQYHGKVMEIRHFDFVGFDKSGLRYPQFLRMRPDKTPNECQIANL